MLSEILYSHSIKRRRKGRQFNQPAILSNFSLFFLLLKKKILEAKLALILLWQGPLLQDGGNAENILSQWSPKEEQQVKWLLLIWKLKQE